MPAACAAGILLSGMKPSAALIALLALVALLALLAGLLALLIGALLALLRLALAALLLLAGTLLVLVGLVLVRLVRVALIVLVRVHHDLLLQWPDSDHAGPTPPLPRGSPCRAFGRVFQATHRLQPCPAGNVRDRPGVDVCNLFSSATEGVSMKRQEQPTRDRQDPAGPEAKTAERRDDPAQNWDRQGMPEGPRYGRTQYEGDQLADPTHPTPGAEEGYPDDRGEFGRHTYGQGGRRTREPYATGRGGRGR